MVNGCMVYGQHSNPYNDPLASKAIGCEKEAVLLRAAWPVFIMG
jgi:hypothetical protein